MMFDAWPDVHEHLRGRMNVDNGAGAQMGMDGVQPDSRNPQTALKSRAAMEHGLLDAEPTRVTYPGAGRVYAREIPAHHNPENPYEPFASKLEWELSLWVDSHKIGSNAFDALLSIEGVSVPGAVPQISGELTIS
jgi:hypothetical protein